MPNKFFALIKKAIVPVLALFMIVAESQYLWPGRYHFADDQNLIIGLSPGQYQDHSVFYLTGPVPPAKVFLLRVVKHLNFGTMGRNDFPLKASPADLLLLENNTDNSNFIAGNQLVVVTNNKSYSIVRRNK